MRLGIDIGKVIINGPAHPEGGDTAFFTGDTARMLRTPAMPGSFEAIARLVTLFDGRVWIVSKCGERVERRTLQWLEHHDFAGRTGIPPDHVRFCRQRPDKAIHCAELGITHFVDDTMEVHEALRGLVPHLYLFGERETPQPWLTHTPTWAHAEEAITATLAGTPAGRGR
ncbi:hypothetical protein [Phytohabitans houttuyneae]|uniref:Nucleotidase n=1 Tax=Phytohabitans houttuyneae TaxID=1076126 RepID=A0A6V8K332_9ACTN|nr:hypothetical protein [Phytohabitans houttuyneae]GFJ76207.1 hypothetical protein Phou_003870 [Phytohabitans houttuyneae]